MRNRIKRVRAILETIEQELDTTGDVLRIAELDRAVPSTNGYLLERVFGHRFQDENDED